MAENPDGSSHVVFNFRPCRAGYNIYQQPILRCLILMLAALIGGASLQVEIRDSEVWLIRNGEPKLTHDGKSKLQALLSPSHKL